MRATGGSAWVAGLILISLAAGAARPASADNKWKQSSTVWQQMDKCNRAAIKAFPDYTPQSLVKREAYRRNCLRAANLPAPDTPLTRR